jgi:methionyl-tRNA formyltransferase
LIRALNPRPIARTFFSDGGAMLKVYRSCVIAPEQCEQVAAQSGPAPVAWLQREPGAFGPARLDYDGGRLALVVRAGEGLLELLELQPEGRKKLTAKEFLNGYRKADCVTLGSIAK